MKTTAFLSFVTVLRKELMDTFRDRRTMINLLLVSPLLYPLLLIGMGKVAKDRTETQLQQPITLAVVNREAAPNLMNFLKAAGINATDAPKDVEAQIRDQRLDMALVVDEEYPENFRTGEPATVEIMTDSTRRNADTLVGRLRDALDVYNNQVGSLRLTVRGVSPLLVKPVNVGTRDLAPAAAKKNGFLAFMLPYLLMLTAFLGGAALLFEATAGEREHQSMEPLLTTASKRGSIVSGKMGAATVIGILSIVLTLLGFKLGALIGGESAKMMDVPFVTIISLVFILLPLVVLGAALLTWLAARAKTMKEAQSLIVILMLMPMIPGVLLMINPIKEKLWHFAVPFLSQNQLIQKLLREEWISPQVWATYFAGAFGVAAVFWVLAVLRYNDERLAISG
ncbi:ABC transporter permease [Luteimonas sp. FXH3W]|uniref:ABC transporter permease n=1 Tax=Aquilutibacter rugosus TaxID=3115820 RepID=A0ABU7UZG6_9GAMM